MMLAVFRGIPVAIVLAVLAASAVPIRAEDAVPGSAIDLKLSFAPVVKKVAPAVVNVYVTHRVQSFSSPFNDSFFKEFFGDELGIPAERRENSLGSGVIVSADGIVVTNNHVVKGSGEAEVRVALADKREFDAKVVLLDEKADLAVLKIDGAKGAFPFLEFDDSDAIEVGDLVLAIGNPFGVGQTVTSGIVSALARTGIGTGDAQYFIQTDAAINPGNSGGALVDMNGRLIGINTAIYSRTGGSLGIGFAIPSNLVKPFVESAISGRAIKRPWFGAKLEPVTREIADALGLEKVEGAVVSQVYGDSPAAAAGIKVQDVVVGFDGHAVEDPRALTYRLNTRGTGGTADVKLIRAGQEVVAKLELKEAPQLDAAAQRELSGAHPLDGARVVDMTEAMADELGFPDLAGVVIVAVKSGSIAQGLGLRPGDVIVRVNRTRIDTAERLEKVLAKPSPLWRLDVKRGDQIFQLELRG